MVQSTYRALFLKESIGSELRKKWKHIIKKKEKKHLLNEDNGLVKQDCFCLSFILAHKSKHKMDVALSLVCMVVLEDINTITTVLCACIWYNAMHILCLFLKAYKLL